MRFPVLDCVFTQMVASPFSIAAYTPNKCIRRLLFVYRILLSVYASSSLLQDISFTLRFQEWKPLLSGYLSFFQLCVWQFYFTTSTLICFSIKETEINKSLAHYQRILRGRPLSFKRFLHLLFGLILFAYFYASMTLLVRFALGYAPVLASRASYPPAPVNRDKRSNVSTPQLGAHSIPASTHPEAFQQNISTRGPKNLSGYLPRPREVTNSILSLLASAGRALTSITVRAFGGVSVYIMISLRKGLYPQLNAAVTMIIATLSSYFALRIQLFAEQIEDGSWTFAEILAIRQEIKSLSKVLRIVIFNSFVTALIAVAQQTFASVSYLLDEDSRGVRFVMVSITCLTDIILLLIVAETVSSVNSNWNKLLPIIYAKFIELDNDDQSELRIFSPMSRYLESIRGELPGNSPAPHRFVQTVYKIEKSNFKHFKTYDETEDVTLRQKLHKLSYIVDKEVGFTVLGAFTVNRALLVSFVVTTFSNIVLFLQTSKDYQMLMGVPGSSLPSQVPGL